MIYICIYRKDKISMSKLKKHLYCFCNVYLQKYYSTITKAAQSNGSGYLLMQRIVDHTS
jgi:hypothetical protein